MKPSRILYSLIAAAAILTGATSCNSSNDGDFTQTYSDMFTISSYTDQGMTLSYQTTAFGSSITALSPSFKFNPEQAPVGSRVMIDYRLPEGVEYGTPNANITIATAQKAYIDTLKVAPIKDYPGWDSKIVSSCYVWLTWPYLNTQTTSDFDPQKPVLNILVDEGSIDGSGSAEAYLIIPQTQGYNTQRGTIYTCTSLQQLRMSYPSLRSISLHIPGGNKIEKISLYPEAQS